MFNACMRMLLPSAALLLATMWTTPAMAGDTLAEVKSRGTLRCGVSEGVPGFSVKDAAGRWTGIETDFCRAVAAAALGDAGRVTFVPLRASARFPALRSGAVDLLARSTTWTLGREAGLKVLFAGVLLYDGQGFLVPAASGVKSVAQLNGATVCVEKGTMHEPNLADYFTARGLRVTPLVIDSAAGVVDAFFAGRCGAYSSDASHLAVARLRAPGGQAFDILPERISKEPLGPVVRSGDDEWFLLVRWTLFALIAAEEAGVTPADIRERAREPVVQRVLGTLSESGRVLGVAPDWALRAVEAVGNYGDLFERNLGSQSPLHLERGLNRLWTQGGLMYAPPFR